jgi:hypothetical protein
MTFKKSLAVLALALAAAVAPLQATTRATDYPGSVSILLDLPAARSDLGLSSKQKSQLKTIRKELEAKTKAILQKSKSSQSSVLTTDQRLFGMIDLNNAEALAVLTPDQLNRFHEIQNRMLGYTMVFAPKVQKQLRLSKSQIGKIEKIRVRGLEFVAQANRSFEEGTMNHDKRLEVLRDYRIDQSSEIKKILTPAQTESFAKLCGKPVKGY